MKNTCENWWRNTEWGLIKQKKWKCIYVQNEKGLIIQYMKLKIKISEGTHENYSSLTAAYIEATSKQALSSNFNTAAWISSNKKLTQKHKKHAAGKSWI